jgi:hypothetical protein
VEPGVGVRVPHLEHLNSFKSTFQPSQEPDITRILPSAYFSITIVVLSHFAKAFENFSANRYAGRFRSADPRVKKFFGQYGNTDIHQQGRNRRQ